MATGGAPYINLKWGWADIQNIKILHYKAKDLILQLLCSYAICTSSMSSVCKLVSPHPLACENSLFALLVLFQISFS